MNLFLDYSESCADFYDFCLATYGINDPRTVEAYLKFEESCCILDLFEEV